MLIGQIIYIKPEKKIRRQFELFLGFAIGAALLSAFRDASFMKVLSNIAFGLAAFMAVLHIVSMNWIVFLSRKEKYKSLGYSFCAIICNRKALGARGVMTDKPIGDSSGLSAWRPRRRLKFVVPRCDDGVMSTATVVPPAQRLEVLFEELAELAGQRNAIDGRIVEIVAEMDRDELCGATGARSVPALVAWKLGTSSANAHTIAAVARRLEEFPRCAQGLREGRLSLDQVGVIAARAGEGSDEHYAQLASVATVNQLRTAIRLEPRPEPDPRSATAALDHQDLRRAVHQLADHPSPR